MLLHDTFFEERLNPLFLETIRGFWNQLETAKESEPAQVEAAQLNLLKFLFTKLFLKEYNALDPKNNGPVFFLANVHTDGVGDYFSLLKCAKKFIDKHPKAEVHIAYTFKQKLPEIDPKDYGLTEDKIHPFFEKTDQEAIQSLKSELEKASVIVNIALAWNTFDDPVLSPKSFYFSETGNFQGIGNALQRQWYSMGLLPFEEGIFQERTFDLSDPWKNQDLEKLFKKSKKPFIGYLNKIPEQLLLWIYLVCLLQKEDREDIEIIIPKLLRENKLTMDTDWIEKQGIKSIVSLNFDKGGTEDILFEGESSSGKTLRLIPALPCDGADFEKMAEHTKEIMGCTGDGSLSDCLIAEKIPFYELRPHKVETMQAFQEIANFMRFYDIVDYFNTLVGFKEYSLTETAENLHKIMLRPNFKSQWESMFEFIKKYANFEDNMNGRLNRFLYFQQSPSAASVEEQLVHEYYQRKNSAYQTCILLKESF